MSRLKAVYRYGPPVVARAAISIFRNAVKMRAYDTQERYERCGTGKVVPAGRLREVTTNAGHAGVSLGNAIQIFRTEWIKEPSLLSRTLHYLEDVILTDMPKLRAILFKLPKVVDAYFELLFAKNETATYFSPPLAGWGQSGSTYVEKRALAVERFETAERNFGSAREEFRQAWNTSKTAPK